MPQPIVIATDGSCIQQGTFRAGDETQRPGAAGFVARMPDGVHVGKADPYVNGTIGTMEIKGLRMGLEFAAAVADRTEQRIVIKCDSQFVVNGFNDWLKGWAVKNYSKKGGLTGADDWRAIDALKQSLGDRVRVEWVKGHSGDPMNDRVDSIVNGSARSQKPFDDTAKVLGPDSDRTTATPSQVAAPPSRETPTQAAGGVRAQAAALLAKAADNPELASVLAEGIGHVLRERGLADRLGPDSLNEAQALQAVLHRRSQER